MPTSPRLPWALAGVVTGVAGLATSYAVAMVLTIRESPVVAVAELVIRLTPGPVAEEAIGIVGRLDKPLLVLGVVLFVLAASALAGVMARESWLRPQLVWLGLAAVGMLSVLVQRGAGAVDVIPVLVGLVTWVALLPALTAPLRLGESHPELASRERRVFLMVAGVLGVAAVGVAVAGRVVGAGRRHVVESRRLLRLDDVTLPDPPAGVTAGVEGVAPWQTPNDDFYLIDTAISVPAIEPKDWRLRIHGQVEREMVLTYDDLIARGVTEAWMTLNCVSNEVGGGLVGNAWWSGVRIADLLEEAGVRGDADCVLQTSEDGWNCATPLSALTDDRGAMLAIAMNGRPLPLEHGFPVRSIVPGLYGYVSATKWVVDFEVTRFADVAAFWTQRGWSEEGPVKIASRIDVPGAADDVDPGPLRVGGVAWKQHTGIAAVEVALDGGAWQRVELAATPSEDTWVQWSGTLDVTPGDHTLRVRAVGRDGDVQTGAVADVVPDGSTGWHTVDFSVRDA